MIKPLRKLNELRHRLEHTHQMIYASIWLALFFGSFLALVTGVTSERWWGAIGMGALVAMGNQGVRHLANCHLDKDRAFAAGYARAKEETFASLGEAMSREMSFGDWLVSETERAVSTMSGHPVTIDLPVPPDA